MTQPSELGALARVGKAEAIALVLQETRRRIAANRAMHAELAAGMEAGRCWIGLPGAAVEVDAAEYVARRQHKLDADLALLLTKERELTFELNE